MIHYTTLKHLYLICSPRSTELCCSGGQLCFHVYLAAELENITIFSKISKYRKYKKYHDSFDILDIFDIFNICQKMKISNKLYNNGCNTLMQYLMTISYQSFVSHVKT